MPLRETCARDSGAFDTDDTQLRSCDSYVRELFPQPHALRGSTGKIQMTRLIFALLAFALIAAPDAARAAVFNCSTALETAQEAADAIAQRAANMDKTQRCSVASEVLPLFERQVTIAEICEANVAKLTAAKEIMAQGRKDYQRACRAELPLNVSKAF